MVQWLSGFVPLAPTHGPWPQNRGHVGFPPMSTTTNCVSTTAQPVPTPVTATAKGKGREKDEYSSSSSVKNKTVPEET